MSDICLFYDDQPLYPKLGDDLGSSLSQVEGIDVEHVTTIFMNHIDETKPEEKFAASNMKLEIVVLIIFLVNFGFYLFLFN